MDRITFHIFTVNQNNSVFTLCFLTAYNEAPKLRRVALFNKGICQQIPKWHLEVISWHKFEIKRLGVEASFHLIQKPYDMKILVDREQQGNLGHKNSD